MSLLERLELPPGIVLNDGFTAAVDVIASGRCVFVTGKAGSGKSTLLTMIRHGLDPEPVVVAPTGVAALNVDGSTIHRFFGFSTTTSLNDVTGGTYWPRTKNVMKHLQVLIVDEVSMVRADLLDMMDAALRKFGPRPGEPFGGVQLVMFGDLYQLPPVVVDAELDHLLQTYSSPYFFAATCLREFEYDLIELDTIYRQSDPAFIEVLNAVRVGAATQAHLDVLNERFDKTFEPDPGDFYVELTTTNRLADTANRKRLAELPGDERVVDADISGQVETSDYPTAHRLALKVGAQIMMLVNEPSGVYVNGSLGTIAAINTDPKRPANVLVDVDLINQEGDRIGHERVGAHLWEIQRPAYVGGKFGYETVGTFTQLPMKLAWASTIHKSQGQTLQRAIVNLGFGTFADGQLYVGLSRCTSLEGTVLRSQVRPHHVKVDPAVTRFLQRRATPTGTPTPTRFACVGVVPTGYDRYDKIVELAAIIIDDSAITADVSTLINPMRDVGATSEHGITASDVSAAPTADIAMPLFLSLLDGCVLVGHDIGAIQTLLERHTPSTVAHVDLGLGIDLRDTVGPHLRATAADHGFPIPRPATASDLAEAITGLYQVLVDDLVDQVVRPVSVTGRPGADVPLLLTRAGRMNAPLVTPPDPSADSPTRMNAYADQLALILAVHPLASDAGARLKAAAAILELAEHDVTTVHHRYIDTFTQLVAADGTVDVFEYATLTDLCTLLGAGIPDGVNPPGDGDVLELTVGMRVCFTGDAQDPTTGNPLSKAELGELAEAHGLTQVGSVTKSKCDVVVAADPASMSGKAKKARDYGKPVISIPEFLTALDAVVTPAS